MTSWKSLTPALSDHVLTTIGRLGFASTTPVQASAIPLFLSKKDVAAEAVTGSGKTLAFVIPIVEILGKLNLGHQDVGALIVSPTRELASQISEVLQEFLRDCPRNLKQMLLIGGQSIAEDLRKFEEEGANIIVCTPGRLEDILMGKTMGNTTGLKKGLKALEILVLDEADRLLSLGFENAVDTILGCLPKLRRTGLFSATQTKDVEKLIRAGLRNPVLVSVKEKESDSSSDLKTTPSLLDNYYLICKPEAKFSTLVSFLRDKLAANSGVKIMVFFATCAAVEYFSVALSRLLKNRNIISIHGKKAKRKAAFEAFRKAKDGILLCTDVMARGIDVPLVDWVIQFDPPSNAEAFVHRCGRTARSGNKGSALLFLLPSEDAYVNFIAINQRVVLRPLDEGSQSDIQDLLPQLRDWQRNDRSLMDKANRAYVSYIQAYSKHECKFVLRLKDLPLGAVATSYGLLKMPRMPELKKRKIVGFVADSTTRDFNDIKYKDKQKEKSRQEKLRVYRETGVWPGFKPKLETSKAWSDKCDKRNRRDLRKKRKELKELKRKQQQGQDAQDNNDDEELEELEQDYRMLKRLKRGKATQEDFDKQISLDVADEVEDETSS